MAAYLSIVGWASPRRMGSLSTEWDSLARRSGKRKLSLDSLSKALPEGNSTEWSSDLSILRRGLPSVERTFGSTTPSGADLRIMSLQALRMSMKLYNIVLYTFPSHSRRIDQEFFLLWGIRHFAGSQGIGASTSYEDTTSSQAGTGLKMLKWSSVRTTHPTYYVGSSISQESSNSISSRLSVPVVVTSRSESENTSSTPRWRSSLLSRLAYWLIHLAR